MTKHIFRVPVDTKHFEDTITKGKNYDVLEQFFSGVDREQLPAGTLRYWGSLPVSSNVRTFGQMEAGDEIIFYRIGKYVGVATIAYKTVNPELARFSWGEKKGATWELVYFFKDVKLLSLDMTTLNEPWGLKLSPVLGFSKVSDERVQPFLQEHGTVAKFLSKQKLAA